MSQVNVYLNKEADRVVGVVKSLYGFSSKDKAIQFIIKKEGRELLKEELRPEYIRKLKRIEKDKAIDYSSFEEFVNDIEGP